MVGRKKTEAPGIILYRLESQLKTLLASDKVSDLEKGAILREIKENHEYGGNWKDYIVKHYNKTGSWADNLISLVRKQEILTRAGIKTEIPINIALRLGKRLELYPEEFVRAYLASLRGTDVGYAIQVQLDYLEHKKKEGKKALEFDEWWKLEQQKDAEKKVAKRVEMFSLQPISEEEAKSAPEPEPEEEEAPTMLDAVDVLIFFTSHMDVPVTKADIEQLQTMLDILKGRAV